VAVLIWALLLLGGCEMFWPKDNYYDPLRCDPACTGKLVCRGGECVPGDGGQPDSGALDSVVVDTLPPDTKPGTCGNNNCDPGENNANCPEDCPPPCVNGTTKCVGMDKWAECDKNAWVTMSCLTICSNLSFDFTKGCRYDSIKSTHVCECGMYLDFGDKCTTVDRCRPPLDCFGFPSGDGFCSKACAKLGDTCPGAPPKTVAKCIWKTKTSEYICGFTCDPFFVPCPAGLKCDFSVITLEGTCKP